MAITTEMVKELRERTGAGMMNCKNALVESEGDIDKAIELLREKGLAAAAKKAGRVAAEGLVDAYIDETGKVGVLVEVNCETDFVANTDNFKNFVRDVAKHIATASPEYLSLEETPDADPAKVLMEQKFTGDEGKTIKDLISDATVSIGEKISIRRFVRYALEGEGLIDAYIHMGGKIGVLIEIGCESAAVSGNADLKSIVHDIAMHIAAAKPEFLTRAEVPTDNLDKEREILRAQALNEGKPEQIVERMVEGRIEKYYKEVVLLEQGFVKDPDKSIKVLLDEASKTFGETISIRRFTRFERGEGIEKRQDNFAAEIAEQMSKAGL